MFFAWLKRYMPRGLYGRAALIMLVPIVGIQLIVSVVFIQRHFDGVTRQMTSNLTHQITYLLDEVNAAPDAQAAADVAHDMGRKLGIVTRFAPETALVGADQRLFYDLSGRAVVQVLYDSVPAVREVDLISNPRLVELKIDSDHGLLNMRISRSRVSASNPHQLLVLMIVSGVAMTLISIIFLRNQLRPIRRLARASEAFGRGQIMPYSPSGAVEVRSAGAAFVDMRNRIERQIEQRTMMLSGVSHDLRTPLTRFRLGLSLLADREGAEALEHDVEEMEHLLDAFLAFARGDALDDPERLDPTELVRACVEKAGRNGADVRLVQAVGAGEVRLRPRALTRALDNLIGNALRYGSRADVSVHLSDKALVLRVDDDGPGIPEALREEALKPFARLDAARNQDQGSGVGLGLAITQDIARRHGGTLRLGSAPDLGGLRADIVLPR